MTEKINIADLKIAYFGEKTVKRYIETISDAESTLRLGVLGFLHVRAGDGKAAAVQNLNQRISAGAAAANKMNGADAVQQLGVIHTKNHNSGHLKKIIRCQRPDTRCILLETLYYFSATK